jgi:Na+/H+ antiporter NhaC
LKKIVCLILTLFCFSTANAFIVDWPIFTVENIDYIVTLNNCDSGVIHVSEEQIEWLDDQGIERSFKIKSNEDKRVIISQGELNQTFELSPIPNWMSIVPPILAILLALIFKEVISSLLIGVISGGLILGFYGVGLLEGFLLTGSRILNAVVPMSNEGTDQGHISVIVFSLLIGGMVNLISVNGGMGAVVEKITRIAKTPKKGLLATWLMGLAIFFDDYANTLIVGNAMRPITDRLKISREKLAYIVDSTAAPVAAIALVTTWIGAELGYIEEGISTLSNWGGKGAFMVFIDSLAYSFYPIFTLLFVLIIILTGKDFGPMAKTKPVEKEIENETKLVDESKWYLALIPVLVLVFGTLAGLYATGIKGAPEGLSIADIIGRSDSYTALIWSSFSAIMVAALLSLLFGKLKLKETAEAAIDGFKHMFSAIVILILAWSLAEVTSDLKTAEFLAGFLENKLDPIWMPTAVFVISALVSFATGSSWGTMAILYPLVIASTWHLSMQAGLNEEEAYGLLANAISTVMAGSVLGDHCSPISDTTILSSLATGCDHIAHVRTQLPYALVVATVSLVLGTIMSSFGMPIWLIYVLGSVILFSIVSYLGKKPTKSALNLD